MRRLVNILLFAIVILASRGLDPDDADAAIPSPAPGGGAEPTVAIIVNQSNPVENFSFDELRKIFLGERSHWPNGRRIGDDVADIALTAIASGPTYSTVTVVGDNVSANDQLYNQVFPYLGTPHSGTSVSQRQSP